MSAKILSTIIITFGTYVLLGQLAGLKVEAWPASPGDHMPLLTKSILSRVQNRSKWKPAVYRGLKIGQSTRTEMLSILGTPERSEQVGRNSPNSEIWYHYVNPKEFSGDLVVVTSRRSEVIIEIRLNPKELSKQEAVKYFGDDYLVTRYSFDRCLGDEEAAPIYESPIGEITFIEYRQRGIALGIDYRDKVTEINYVRGPIGAASSKCKKAARVHMQKLR